MNEVWRKAINVIKCNLGKVNLKAMLLGRFPNYAGGLPSASSRGTSWLVYTVACFQFFAKCCHNSLCLPFCAVVFTLPQTMATLWTNNSLSTGFYDESSQPDALLSTESSVPSSPPCIASSAPQSSSTVSVPVAIRVPDPAFLVHVVNAVKAFLVCFAW